MGSLALWSLRVEDVVYTGLDSRAKTWREPVPALCPSPHPLACSHNWEPSQKFGGGKLFWWPYADMGMGMCVQDDPWVCLGD